MNLPVETKVSLYRGMSRIRMLQERIEREYLDDQMKTPVHLYIGQEAIAVGVCALLQRDDYINSNHRGHGHYLAKGGRMEALVAELFCKDTGCSRGRGGSMHLIDKAVGHYGSSAIVGGGIPIGTGMGLSSRLQGDGKVSVVFFGDGAADEGVLYESINFAMLRRLPVVYVLENNQYSVCSPVSARQAGNNIFHGADPDLLWHARIDGNDVLAVYAAAEQAVTRARAGKGPAFIECITYRILGHAGCMAQDPSGYRPPGEVEKWQAKCPLRRFEKYLVDEGVLDDAGIGEIQRLNAEEIDSAFRKAAGDPLPPDHDLDCHLYYEA